jgi:hypothetical protein
VLFKYFVQPYILRMQLADATHLDVLVETAEADVEVEVPAAAAPPPGAPPAAAPDSAQPVIVTIRS